MSLNRYLIISVLLLATSLFTASPIITGEIVSDSQNMTHDSRLFSVWITISVSDAKSTIMNTSDLFILDVRTQSEYDEGHIEGATLIPHTEITTSDDLPVNMSTPILVYCRSGSRSATASQSLEDLGYTVIWNMANGLANGWIPAGYFITVSVSEANNLVSGGSNLVIIDVRSQQEYAEGHIGGAINIPLTELSNSSDLPVDNSTPILVYCSSGSLSAAASQQLEDLGYTKVKNMGGGFNEWISAGYSTGTTRVTTNSLGLDLNLLLVGIIPFLVIIRKRISKR